MPFVNAEVYCDASEFTDDELLEEMSRRNLGPTDLEAEIEVVVRDIYQRRQLRLNYETRLCDLFDLVLGRLA